MEVKCCMHASLTDILDSLATRLHSSFVSRPSHPSVYGGRPGKSDHMQEPTWMLGGGVEWHIPSAQL